MPNPTIRFTKANGTPYPDWASVRLGDVAERVTRKNTGNISSNVLTISAQYGLINQEDFFNKQIASKHNEHYILLQKGEFAYNKSYSAGYPFGVVKRLDKYEQGIVSNLYIFFSIDETKINGDFLIQYFETPFWHEEITKIAQEGARNHGLLNVKTLEFFETQHRWPCLEEQQKIANFFTSLDEEINAENTKLAEMQAYKKSMLQKIFSREIAFGSEEWASVRLGDVAEINPKNADLPQQFIYIDLESVTDGKLTLNPPIDLSSAPSRAQRVLKNHDIIFQMVRPYQRNNLYFNLLSKDSLPYVASTGYAQIRAKQNPMCLYQYLFFDPFVDEVLKYCTGSNYPAINSSDLADIIVTLPTDVEEQEKIANFFSALDEQIRLQQLKADNISLYKKAMLQQMFI